MNEQLPLLVLGEEDVVLADITSFRLELIGYRVETLNAGEAILRRLSQLESLPALLILDSVLPDMDGIELTNRLSSDARTAHVPVLMISTDADLDTVQRAYTAGARDYLVIPYDPSILEQKVAKLITTALAPS